MLWWLCLESWEVGGCSRWEEMIYHAFHSLLVDFKSFDPAEAKTGMLDIEFNQMPRLHLNMITSRHPPPVRGTFNGTLCGMSNHT